MVDQFWSASAASAHPAYVTTYDMHNAFEHRFAPAYDISPPVLTHAFSASVPPPAPRLSAAAVNFGLNGALAKVNPGIPGQVFNHHLSPSYLEGGALPLYPIPSYAQHHQVVEYNLLLAAQYARQRDFGSQGAWAYDQPRMMPVTEGEFVADPRHWNLPPNLGLGHQSAASGAPVEKSRTHVSDVCEPRRQEGFADSERSSPGSTAFAGVSCSLILALVEELVRFGLDNAMVAGGQEVCLDTSSPFVQLIAPIEDVADRAVFASLRMFDPSHESEVPLPHKSAQSSPPLLQSGTQKIFLQFTMQVLTQTQTSPTALILALLYVLQLPAQLRMASWETREEFNHIFNRPSSSAPFKLLVLGLMVANKHLDDNTFLNKTWHEVTGIPLHQLNRIERFYFRLTNYRISPSDKAWSSHISRLRHFCMQHIHVSVSRDCFGLHSDTVTSLFQQLEVGSAVLGMLVQSLDTLGQQSLPPGSSGRAHLSRAALKSRVASSLSVASQMGRFHAPLAAATC